MENYTINADLADERLENLDGLLLVSFWLGLLFFGLSTSMNPQMPDAWAWVCLLCTLAATKILSLRKRSELAGWAYLLGLLGVASLVLLRHGPDTTIYLLFVVPVILTVLVFDRANIVKLALLSVALMFGLTAVHTNFSSAVNQTLIPSLLAGLLAGVLYVNTTSVLETLYWATDIQKKDTRRAEEFFQQKEQLAHAMLELRHANSRLEQMNDELARAQRKAEEASNAKSVFLSNMSHELRTPLNVIIGYTSTMLDMPAIYENVPLPVIYRKDIQQIKDSGFYLLGLINDILDLSKIEANKLELHCTSVNLSDTFQGLLATSVGLVKDKPIQIRPDFPPDLPNVWADPIRVRQIILNLMSNAIKFTPTGSVTLQAGMDGDRVRISVIDTGIGIPEEALKHIFDRFAQAEHDTDKKYGGTGLGLDISKQLAVMHGGDLIVESSVGSGSSFTFTLARAAQFKEFPTQPKKPAALSTAEIRTVQQPTPPPTADEEDEEDETVETLAYTILLVEDEASLREMMRRTLESVGYVVADVQDGAQVIDLAVGLLPELIILDVRLPNLNGWELLTSLKSNSDTAAIPVIISTVNDDEEHALKLGASLYLRKPFSSDELLACAQELLPQEIQPTS